MRIAFDVKGTLEGPKGVTIRYLLNQLQKAGHEVVVWSNLYSYAKECVEKYNLTCEFRSKASVTDLRNYGEELFDLAFEDDTSQEYLGSRHFIWVHQVPTESEDIQRLAESLTSGQLTDTICHPNEFLQRIAARSK